jgi:hypothetical protein
VNLAVLALAAAVGTSAAPASVANPAPVGRVLFHLADKRIGEASGVAVATREPDVWFTHNDSGDSARFFALGPDGHTLVTYDVVGAHNVDWEDMAAAPSPSGVPTLWFGDIGDNAMHRTSVDVYAVPEPNVLPGVRGATVHVHGVRYRFSYPDGPHNAETLLVDPRTSRIYIATKSYDGITQVYAAPAKPSTSRVNRLTHVSTLHWGAPHAVLSLVDIPPELATTGGAFSPDGATVVLRTYTDAYLFPVSGTGPAALAKAFSGTPRRISLPKQPQGEGICFRRDGLALVLTSERPGSAVDEVLIPKETASTVAEDLVASPSPVAPRVTLVPTIIESQKVVVGPVRAHPSSWRAAGAAVAAVVVIGGGIVLWRRS